jgi:hypothetical protein
MKSKSESLIASESRAGVRKDDADQHKQKPLKRGKDWTLAAVRGSSIRYRRRFCFAVIARRANRSFTLPPCPLLQSYVIADDGAKLKAHWFPMTSHYYLPLFLKIPQ